MALALVLGVRPNCLFCLTSKKRRRRRRKNGEKVKLGCHVRRIQGTGKKENAVFFLFLYFTFGLWVLVVGFENMIEYNEYSIMTFTLYALSPHDGRPTTDDR